MAREVTNLKVGDQVDARDQDYVWCVATVILVIEIAEKPNLVSVHFEGWKNLKDEFLPENSIRLAPFGHHTNKFEIPRYLVISSQSSEILRAEKVNFFSNVKELKEDK